MGSLVVGSGDIASFVAESEVGAAILPALGGVKRQRLIDRTRLGPGMGSLRKDLLAFYPLLNDSYYQPIDIRTGRRAYAWNTLQRLSTDPIQRGGAAAHPITAAAQFSHPELFNGNPGGASDLGTISCWIKIQADDTNLIPVMMIGQNLSECVFLGFFNGTFMAGAQSVAFGIVDVVVTPAIYTIGRWYHVVWMSDGIAWRIWVDGVERSMTPVVGFNDGYWAQDLDFLGTAQLDLTVGRQTDLVSSSFFAVHEAGIWDRALTQSEINQLYKNPDSVYARTFQVLDVDPSTHTNVRVCPLKHIYEMLCAVARVGAAPRMQALSHVFEMQPSAAVMGAAPTSQALSHVFEMQPSAAVMGAAPASQTLSHIYEMQVAAAVVGAAPTAQTLSHIYEMQVAAAIMGAAPTAQTLSHIYEMQHATAVAADAALVSALRQVFLMQPANVSTGTSVPVCKIEHVYTIPTVAAVMGAAPTAQALSHVYETQSATVIVGGAPRTATLSHVYVTQPATVALGTVVLVCSLHLRHVLWPVEIDTPVAPVLVTQITATLLDSAITASIETPSMVASLTPDAITASVTGSAVTASLAPDAVTATVVDDTLNATLDCG